FFQMRVGTWNQGAYSGFPDKPELQAKWFIDNALDVKRQAIAKGDANFGKDPSKYGEWIADGGRRRAPPPPSSSATGISCGSARRSACCRASSAVVALVDRLAGRRDDEPV